jgi:O6-methylguanine-DNA--protein-cysteine methyltransferase
MQPYHRVIGESDHLTGDGTGIREKECLLPLEGASL